MVRSSKLYSGELQLSSPTPLPTTHAPIDPLLCLLFVQLECRVVVWGVCGVVWVVWVVCGVVWVVCGGIKGAGCPLENLKNEFRINISVSIYTPRFTSLQCQLLI
jgi:hypothetical protein